MRVEPKAIIRKLTPTATRLLEAAVGRAASGGYYEIAVEHFVATLLEPDEGDVARLLHHFSVDRQKLSARAERELQRMKTGHSGRPLISERIFTFLEDAWLTASVDLGATALRSGHLLYQLASRPDRYLGDEWPELAALPLEEVKREFDTVLAPSPESLEAQPFPSGEAPAAGGGPARAEALGRFTTNFTERAREGKIDPIFGRHREIRQLVDILARRRKNNPIVVGEPGVGKTALVEGLALAIAEGDVPESLRNVDLLGLDLGLLQAGASVRGEFENRLKAVIGEVKASPKPIVLFIDEAHTLIGAGGAVGGSDAANLLKPALARGELRTIAATTWSEYKKYFEKDAALERRFQPVKVDEPGEEDAVLMLRGLRSVYEKAHGVTIRDEAVVEAVRLSRRYVSGRQLPDKAVDLLDTATARVKVALASKPEELSALELDLAGLEREREALRRDLAEGPLRDEGQLLELEGRMRRKKDELESLRARFEGERAAVERLRAARSALSSPGADAVAGRAAVDAAAAELKKLQGEEPLLSAEVDGAAVARIVASWTGVPVGKMRSDQVKAVLGLEASLAARVRGQPEALRTVAETLRMSHAGIRDPRTPLGVLLFVGPSGVGKTETAIALADALYGGERFMTTLNMSEFQEKHTVSRLIGSPPGYVGYGEGGLLTEAVRQRPYSVVLLDECEKAELDVLNLFYQVFDKGSLTDGEGREVDFKNALLILTSNLGTDAIVSAYEGGAKPSAEEVVKGIRPLLSGHFKPALLARMTIVPFAPLPSEILREIVELKLSGLARRLAASHRVEAAFAPELVLELVRRCTEPETGARNVEHVLRGSLMPLLSRAILERLSEGALPRQLGVGLDAQGEFRVDLGDA
ncbi:MAG TPA: type VI secretion system ATPase TssH [Anaeromyxobacteraceae bacterium]|nr:type VI secretion system ATPase TssH [Anaeromyxobacteraceae bacterium]